MAKERNKHKSKHKFAYPKLLALVIFSILSYIIFKYSGLGNYMDNLGGLSYLGIFIAGMLFSFGFSAPFAVGFFLAIDPKNIYLAFLIGGIGSLVTDLTILKFTRFSFRDEFRKLEETKFLKHMGKAFSSKHLVKIKVYFLYLLAAIVIASPLPDELGVTMLGGLTKISTKVFMIVSFVMNSLGILIILLLGRTLF